MIREQVRFEMPSVNPTVVIVFDVSGIIRINERLVFSKNLTIAGQTAPGNGVVIYGNGVSFSGANDIIVRHLRIRMGTSGDGGKDAAGIANGSNMIFDHCSVSWGKDETFSINSDGKGGGCRKHHHTENNNEPGSSTSLGRWPVPAYQ